MPYQSVNPSNGELLRTFDEHTDADMERMLVRAAGDFSRSLVQETHP